MHAARQPTNVGRPAARGGGDPEEEQDAGCDDGPLPQADGSFHATESRRMSDACGVGLLPSSSRRAKNAALFSFKASTTAGADRRPAPLPMGRAADSKGKAFPEGRAQGLASQGSAR